jgi:hypothetical protein
MPKHPQPVPPIFQPEVPAEVVYYAAHHRRREITVGFSAIKAIRGGQLAPWFADWYLARTGYKSQQVQDMPIDRAQWRDNLFEPVPDKAATHGIFDHQARGSSAQVWANTHRGWLAAALAAAGGAIALALKG